MFLVQVAPDGDAQVWVSPDHVAAVADVTPDAEACEIVLTNTTNTVSVDGPAAGVVARLGDAYLSRSEVAEG